MVADFIASLAWVLPTLVICALATMSVCNISFVELLMFLFGVFSGMCDESSCNVFLQLFMVLWDPISTMVLCKRAVLMLWHAFLFLGLRFFPALFFFLPGGRCCFSCKKLLISGLYQLGKTTGTGTRPLCFQRKKEAVQSTKESK
jgi:hypothetical protein